MSAEQSFLSSSTSHCTRCFISSTYLAAEAMEVKLGMQEEEKEKTTFEGGREKKDIG